MEEYTELIFDYDNQEYQEGGNLYNLYCRCGTLVATSVKEGSIGYCSHQCQHDMIEILLDRYRD